MQTKSAALLPLLPTPGCWSIHYCSLSQGNFIYLYSWRLSLWIAGHLAEMSACVSPAVTYLEAAWDRRILESYLISEMLRLFQSCIHHALPHLREGVWLIAEHQFACHCGMKSQFLHWILCISHLNLTCAAIKIHIKTDIRNVTVVPNLMLKWTEILKERINCLHIIRSCCEYRNTPF